MSACMQRVVKMTIQSIRSDLGSTQTSNEANLKLNTVSLESSLGRKSDDQWLKAQNIRLKH